MTRPKRKRTHTALSVGQLEEGQLVEARYGEHVNENEPPRNVFQRTTSVQLDVRQRVEARYQGKSHAWHPGVVQHINEDGTLAIDFDDGDQEARVKRKHVRPPKTEAPPPSTPAYAETSSGRPVFEVDRLRASWANQYDGKRGSITQKTMESKPKRTPQGRGSLSCVQNLSEKMCSAGGPLPQPSFEEEQVEAEVGLFDSEPSAMVGWWPCGKWLLEFKWLFAAEEVTVSHALLKELDTCLASPPPPQPSSEQEEERMRHMRPALSVVRCDSDPMPSPRSASSSSTSASASASASDCADSDDGVEVEDEKEVEEMEEEAVRARAWWGVMEEEVEEEE